MALALSVGASFSEAALLANFAAGIVVGKIGTATLTLKEIRTARKDAGRSAATEQ
jgi:bifunctional ADP-heptose synthase (sugar kinase/adenylyltransferase)